MGPLRLSPPWSLGLALLWSLACGRSSLTPAVDASIDLAEFLPAQSCGGTGKITGTTPIGAFQGDVMTVQAIYGTDTSISVYAVDTHTGAGLSWQSVWMVTDGGAALSPSDSPTVAVFTSRNHASSWEVPGTVNVLGATNPAAAFDAGHGGLVQESVTFAQSGFNLSGSLTSPYCTISSPIKISP